MLGTPTSPILDALRSAISYLRDEDHLTALIEAANGQDDHYDPVSAETAEAMRCSEGNVKSQCARGLDRLREAIPLHAGNIT